MLDLSPTCCSPAPSIIGSALLMSLQVFNQFTNGALANRLDICCRSPNFPKSCKFKIWGLRGIECGPICLSRHSHFQRAQVPEHVAERGLRFFNKSKEERFWNALAWEAFRSIQEAKWCECERLWMFFFESNMMHIDVHWCAWEVMEFSELALASPGTGAVQSLVCSMTGNQERNGISSLVAFGNGW